MCRTKSSTGSCGRETLLCQFSTIRLDKHTWLIRENDVFGEFPHIYARLCSVTDDSGNKTSLIVLSDTGVGTTDANRRGSPSFQNIREVIEYHVNPDRDIPYLIILSHCHYDHILGLQSFLPHDQLSSSRSYDEPVSQRTVVSVMSSSFQKSFVTPYEVLEEHSLCNDKELPTPRFDISIWALDRQRIVYKEDISADVVLPIITIHTPGHTPDSLSWFDMETRRLYVGDSLYQQESDYSRRGPWGREDPAPIIFPNEGNVLQWWRSVEKLEDLVAKENVSTKPRVTLAAGHVTTDADAADCLKNAKCFMAAVLRGDIACRPLPDKRGKATRHWTVDEDGAGKQVSEFSVIAPLFVIEEGRASVPRTEWVTREN